MKSSKKNIKKTEQDPLAGDLSHLFEENGWQQVRFEFKPKNKTLTIRVSNDLLKAVKERAKEAGLDYQKWVRIALEHMVEKKVS